MAAKEFLELTMKKLADEGKLVEAGWVGLRLAVGLENAPADQLREMRLAFLGGAQHLFSSIMSVLDPSDEPTDADLKRMHLIAAELEAAAGELVAGYEKARPATKPEKPDNLSTALGDAPIETDYREMMNSMAQYLDRFFNGPAPDAPGGRKTGFVLLVFPFDDHVGRCNYISNGRREDVVVLLKEQLARFEGSPGCHRPWLRRANDFRGRRSSASCRNAGTRATRSGRPATS